MKDFIKLIFATFLCWGVLGLWSSSSVYAGTTVTLSPASGSMSSNITTVQLKHDNPSGEEISVIQFDLAYSGSITYTNTTASGSCSLLAQPSGNPLLITFITCTPALSAGTTHTLGSIAWKPGSTGNATLTITNVDDGFTGADTGGVFSYTFGSGQLPDTGIFDLTDLWSVGLLMLSLGIVISIWGDSIMLKLVGVRWFEKRVSASA